MKKRKIKKINATKLYTFIYYNYNYNIINKFFTSLQ